MASTAASLSGELVEAISHLAFCELHRVIHFSSESSSDAPSSETSSLFGHQEMMSERHWTNVVCRVG